jgi:GMP synthase-like glutamine amidotransferase
MARIIVFQHGPNQTPGRLGMTLRDHGFRLDIRRLDIPHDKGGGGVPEDLDGVHGVLSMGGPQNVGDPHPWLARETEFLRAAHRAQLPLIGVCLGAQLIADALGGEVGRMNTPEAGFLPIDILPMGQTDRVLAGIPWRHQQFHSHAYEVKTLPPGATLLASSAACKVQAFTVGVRTYAFQFHPELDRPGIEQLVRSASNLCAAANLDPAAIADQAGRHYEPYARLGDRLAVNLASFLFAPSELLRA